MHALGLVGLPLGFATHFLFIYSIAFLNSTVR